MQRKAALCWLPVVVLTVDLLWLEVPGPDAETVRADILEYTNYGEAASEESLLDRRTRVLLALPVQPVDMVLCAHAHVGCRFLTVAHRNLTAKILDAATFVALRAGADPDEKHLASLEAASLRGRTLRFADLTASELFAADLTDADLRHADMVSATLKKAVLIVAQLQGANLVKAQLQGAYLREAALWNIDADYHAHLVLADPRGANFDEGSAGELLTKLPAGIPELAKQRIRERLTARVGARTLPRQVNTRDGKIPVSWRKHTMSWMTSC